MLLRRRRNALGRFRLRISEDLGCGRKMGRKDRALAFSILDAFGAAVVVVAERMIGLAARRRPEFDILQL